MSAKCRRRALALSTLSCNTAWINGVRFWSSGAKFRSVRYFSSSSSTGWLLLTVSQSSLVLSSMAGNRPPDAVGEEAALRAWRRGMVLFFLLGEA
eukprot:scaffold6180_cov200-Pinguiococcus_pyrenoidosus.AAC.16